MKLWENFGFSRLIFWMLAFHISNSFFKGTKSSRKSVHTIHSIPQKEKLTQNLSKEHKTNDFCYSHDYLFSPLFSHPEKIFETNHKKWIISFVLRKIWYGLIKKSLSVSSFHSITRKTNFLICMCLLVNENYFCSMTFYIKNVSFKQFFCSCLYCNIKTFL